MNNRVIFIGIAVLGALFIAWFTFSGGSEEYLLKIEQWRQENELFYQNDPSSPFAEDSSFSHLNYFAPDINYRVTAEVKKIGNPQLMMLNTSKGTQESYREFAHLVFQLNGASRSLLLFQSTTNEREFFLPFTDQTNSKETYGAGRYLPLDYHGGQYVEVDFNRAYNPYCAYNTEYVCPIPPKENALNTAVKAGEKTYKK